MAVVTWRVGADEVVLEGLHALKHALRFGASVRLAVTPSLDAVLELASALAPDLLEALADLVVEVPAADFAALTTRQLGSPVLSIAVRRPGVAADLLVRGELPAVLLEDPRHAGNAGAVVRVAAAAGISGVLMTGSLDPWSPQVVRAAAGLHYAVGVASCEWPVSTDRPLIAFDPEGALLQPFSLPAGALLAFGSERQGLSQDLLSAAAQVVRLPMTPGVSSLNLATTVAAVLYGYLPNSTGV